MTGVEVEEVEWIPAADGGRPTMKPTGKKEVIEADMVLLAMGFLKPEQPKFAKNVFLAGDAETGASLVVRAMAGGRKAAAEIDAYSNTIRFATVIQQEARLLLSVRSISVELKNNRYGTKGKQLWN